jgi:3-hydroxybutyryl-CoA dehydrogenase
MMRLDEIKTIGVVGAGQMGRGIAQVCATGGYEVLLADVAERVVVEALSKIRVSLDRTIERGTLSQHQAENALARIHPLRATGQMDDLSCAQLIIEAIPEELKLKQTLFADLGRAAHADTILASNTSSISISQLAALSGRADRVVGLHFMNPAPVMQLVEIVQGRNTSESTINVAVELARRLGKIPVVAKDVPGFIVNRILMPMINEAVFALEQAVASAEDIDLAMTTGANHPVGPLALADRIGLDTVLAICDVLHQDLNDAKFRPCPLLREYVEAGWLGRKTGRGFYRYEASGQHREAAGTKSEA